jgi:hypothetical protein
VAGAPAGLVSGPRARAFHSAVHRSRDPGRRAVLVTVIKRFPVTIQAVRLVFTRETLSYRDHGCTGRAQRAKRTPRPGGRSGRGECATLWGPATLWRPGTGDWLSGRAPRSHRGGHWFDPSIAHGSLTDPVPHRGRGLSRAAHGRSQLSWGSRPPNFPSARDDGQRTPPWPRRRPRAARRW